MISRQDFKIPDTYTIEDLQKNRVFEFEYFGCLYILGWNHCLYVCFIWKQSPSSENRICYGQTIKETIDNFNQYLQKNEQSII